MGSACTASCHPASATASSRAPSLYASATSAQRAYAAGSSSVFSNLAAVPGLQITHPHTVQHAPYPAFRSPLYHTPCLIKHHYHVLASPAFCPLPLTQIALSSLLSSPGGREPAQQHPLRRVSGDCVPPSKAETGPGNAAGERGREAGRGNGGGETGPGDGGAGHVGRGRPKGRDGLGNCWRRLGERCTRQRVGGVGGRGRTWADRRMSQGTLRVSVREEGAAQASSGPPAYKVAGPCFAGGTAYGTALSPGQQGRGEGPAHHQQRTPIVQSPREALGTMTSVCGTRRLGVCTKDAYGMLGSPGTRAGRRKRGWAPRDVVQVAKAQGRGGGRGSQGRWVWGRVIL